MKIACLGDSITYYGSPGASAPYCSVLQSLLDADSPGVHIVGNHGKRSDTIAQAQVRYNANVVGKGYDTLVFFCGINDVLSDETAATIEAAAQAVLDDARGRGMGVVLITMSPFANYASFTSARETVRTTVNDWYANYAATNSLPIVDAADLLSDGASPPALAAQYAYGDGLHWSTAACNLIAAQVKTALGL